MYSLHMMTYMTDLLINKYTYNIHDVFFTFDDVHVHDIVIN